MYGCHLFVCGWKDLVSTTCCEKLIIKENKWIFVAEMNEKRSDFQLVTAGKYMWAIGGVGTRVVVNTTEYYDEITDKWEKSSPMIKHRTSHSAVAFGETIYVIGGYGGIHGGTVLSSAEIFDIASQQWTSISSMKFPRSRFGAALNANKLYCFSGERTGASVEYYDVYRRVWVEEGRMRNPNFIISAYSFYVE